MSITKSCRIYGRPGHRQAESFSPSRRYDWSNGRDGTRIVEVINSDITGTNDYTLLRITRGTEALCLDELDGQICDGLFENCCVGDVVGEDGETAAKLAARIKETIRC